MPIFQRGELNKGEFSMLWDTKLCVENMEVRAMRAEKPYVSWRVNLLLIS